MGGVGGVARSRANTVRQACAAGPGLRCTHLKREGHLVVGAVLLKPRHAAAAGQGQCVSKVHTSAGAGQECKKRSPQVHLAFFAGNIPHAPARALPCLPAAPSRSRLQRDGPLTQLPLRGHQPGAHRLHGAKVALRDEQGEAGGGVRWGRGDVCGGGGCERGAEGWGAARVVSKGVRAELGV